MFCLFNKYEQYFSHNGKVMCVSFGSGRFQLWSGKALEILLGKHLWVTAGAHRTLSSDRLLLMFPWGYGLTLSFPGFPPFDTPAEKQWYLGLPLTRGQETSLTKVCKNTFEPVAKANSPGPCCLLLCHLTEALATCLFIVLLGIFHARRIQEVLQNWLIMLQQVG